MSHFVTHVFIPAEVPEDGIQTYLDEVLDPYDENKEVDPHISEYVKDEEVESLREKYYADRDDIHSDEELLRDWHGGTIKRNEERGEWEVYSTYNPEQYELEVCSGHGTGREEAQSSWNEVLRKVWGDQARQLFWQGDEGARRPVHVLQGLHDEAEPGTDSRGSSALASEAEVRDHARGVRRHAGEAGREVRYLWDNPLGAAGTDEVGTDESELDLSRGPSSRDGASESPALRSVQLVAGNGEGVIRHTLCGDPLPHGAHLINKKVIGGSKWDWWVIGGRWDGFFNGENIVLATDTTISGKQEEARHDAEREYDEFEKVTEGLTFKPWSVFDKELGHHASEDALSQAREEYHDQEWVKAANGVAGFIWEPPEVHFKVNEGGREAFVRERAMQAGVPYSFIDLEGNWCARGEMGWFGMSSDDKTQEDWSESYINYLHSVPEGTRVVSLDLHI